MASTLPVQTLASILILLAVLAPGAAGLFLVGGGEGFGALKESVGLAGWG